MAVTYEIVDGDQVIMTVDMPDGRAITMPDDQWRALARSVLRECSAAEFKLPPAAVVQRIRDSLADAAVSAGKIESNYVANLQLAAGVLHRVADMIKGGTITAVSLEWSNKTPSIVDVAYRIKMPQPPTEIRLELGRGVVSEVRCDCPEDDAGWQVHTDACDRMLP